MAQFSERPVTDRHRAAAVEALEVSLASIREQRAAMETELGESGLADDAVVDPEKAQADTLAVAQAEDTRGGEA
jgi:hypothetical protein